VDEFHFQGIVIIDMQWTDIANAMGLGALVRIGVWVC